MTCICGHDVHALTEPTVCKDIFCNCEQYVEPLFENSMINQIDLYIYEFNSVKAQEMWIMDNLKFTRNFPNKLFVDFYFEHVKHVFRKNGTKLIPDYETVRRTKQSLAREHHELYGEFECPEFERQKAIKELGVKEWVIAQ